MSWEQSGFLFAAAKHAVSGKLKYARTRRALPRLNADIGGLKCTTLSGGSTASEDANS